MQCGRFNVSLLSFLLEASFIFSFILFGRSHYNLNFSVKELCKNAPFSRPVLLRPSAPLNPFHWTRNQILEWENISLCWCIISLLSDLNSSNALHCNVSYLVKGWLLLTLYWKSKFVEHFQHLDLETILISQIKLN